MIISRLAQRCDSYGIRERDAGFVSEVNRPWLSTRLEFANKFIVAENNCLLFKFITN